jgi:hypothetical protein
MTSALQQANIMPADRYFACGVDEDQSSECNRLVDRAGLKCIGLEPGKSLPVLAAPDRSLSSVVCAAQEAR